MKSPFFLCAALSVFTGLAALTSASGAEPPGEWVKPPADGSSWKHVATDLAFPQIVANYRLVGQFNFDTDAGGFFLRYENRDMRARADLFLFPIAEPLKTKQDIQRQIVKEMDSVIADFQNMVKQGRYKNVHYGDPRGAEIPMWNTENLPIATRLITSTRVGKSSQGIAEAQVLQWVGVTVIKNFIFTIRHMRPGDTGEEGEKDMASFTNGIFLILKDPPLRAEVKKWVDTYMANPFTTESINAAAAVLAYLKKTPFLPIHIPDNPISFWMDHFQKQAPGTEQDLLRAFMLGSAHTALNDGDTDACLNGGARQFGRIYRKLVQQHPRIALPEIEDFITAAEKNQAPNWIKEHGGG